jgi:hypothetical protein
MPQMTDEQLEELGRKIASQCDWDGLAILHVFSEALTDANFHREAEIVEQIEKNIETTEATPHYELTIKNE